jgi:hypothetical protein
MDRWVGGVEVTGMVVRGRKGERGARGKTEIEAYEKQR